MLLSRATRVARDVVGCIPATIHFEMHSNLNALHISCIMCSFPSDSWNAAIQFEGYKIYKLPHLRPPFTFFFAEQLAFVSHYTL
jgi:hypothetical protein